MQGAAAEVARGSLDVPQGGRRRVGHRVHGGRRRCREEGARSVGGTGYGGTVPGSGVVRGVRRPPARATLRVIRLSAAAHASPRSP
ncbi:hypothetical protein GCM10026982_60120 [Nocardiopsis aegyptia]